MMTGFLAGHPLDDNGLIDLSKSHSIGVDGIGNYYGLDLKEKYGYVGNAKFPNKI